MRKVKDDRSVYIVAYRRTPFGKFLGSLKNIPASRLGAFVMKELIKDVCTSSEFIGRVFMGEVLSSGAGQNPARQAALYAGIPETCPTVTVNKVCSSSLVALELASQVIRLGEAHLAIAGGMESMSQAPYLLQRWEAPKDKRIGNRKVIDLLSECQISQDLSLIDSMIHDGLCDIYSKDLAHMGNLADLCAERFKISREEQEAYAFESMRRTLEAQRTGLLNSQLVPVLTEGRELNSDEGIREPDLEKMKSLTPAFSQCGTVTAATSSQISDGAAALILTSGWMTKKLVIKPFAKVVAIATHSQNPSWYTTAPVGAIKKLLRMTELRITDIDYWEINEAFAVVVEYAIRTLKLPRERVNVWGGAIALGHPIGASGARIVGNLAYVLRHYKGRYGVAVACNGGGEAVAVLLENPNLLTTISGVPILISVH